MKTVRWIEVGLLVALAVVIALCGVRMRDDDAFLFRHEAAGATPISLADCAVSEEKIDDFLGVRHVYTFSLPSNLAADDCLILHIMHQYCQVRVGHETRYIYEDGGLSFVRTSGRYWACVRLSAADASKTVVIKLTPVYASVPEPEVSICPLDRMITETLQDDNLLLALSILCLILGLSISVVAMFTVFDWRTKRALLCLAMLTIVAGVWKATGLPVTTLLLHESSLPLMQPKAVYLADMIGFLLVPVFLSQFLNGMRRNDRSVPESICAFIILLTTVVVLTLQLLGKLELQSAVPYLMAENGFLILCILVLMLRRKEPLWLLYLPICACADLLISWLGENSRNAVFLILGIIVSDYISGVVFIRRTIRQRSELRDARMAALLNQIRPHFIHNTLTSIYYLCDSDPQTAKRVVRDFNNHLRANFTSFSAKAPIRFDEEMENVRAYLSVEQVRFSDKLFVEYDTPHTSFRLPALTIQPLVENAVKHNVDGGKPPVHIRISSFKVDGGSKVVIEDDGAGAQIPAEEEHGHVGLKNVADRLELLCGGTLTVSSRPEGGTVVTVFVPDGA